MAKKKEDDIKYTKYETARMLGCRALQISYGAPFMIKLSAKQLEELKYDPIEIAKRELAEEVVPLKIVRHMPRTLSQEEAKKEAAAAE